LPSNKILEQKQALVTELTEKFRGSAAYVLADYRGLTVEQDTELRNALRKAGVEYKVIKNTLSTLALRELGVEGIEEFLFGPTAFAMSATDVVAPAKIMSEYAKKFEKLEIKAGVVEGRTIDEKGVSSLASMPSKEVLVSRVLGSLNAPISGFVNVLNGNLRGLVCALNAIQMQKAQ